MSVRGTLGALNVTFRNLRRPKTTEPLPWKGTRERAERYRASFALVHDEHGEEACIGCALCEKICPSEIITVVAAPKAPSAATGKTRGWLKDFTLDLNACIICELCIQVCPVDAIIMLRVQERPGYQREDLLLTMERLYANEKLNQLAWGNMTRLQAMQEPAKPKREAPAAVAAPPAPAAPAAPAPAAAAPASAVAPATSAPREGAPDA